LAVFVKAFAISDCSVARDLGVMGTLMNWIGHPSRLGVRWWIRASVCYS